MENTESSESAHTFPFPYRSHRKRTFANLGPTQPIPRYVPKKQRKYTLHHIHGPNSWMIDFMELDGKHILNLVHCNSRFWLPTLCLNETAESVMNGLRALYETNLPIDTLISDAAKTFTSTNLVRDFCQTMRIKQIAYDMSRGGEQILPETRQPTTCQFHNQLAIIDRISRTLRDMVFNIRRQLPAFQLTSETLNELARYHNETPHETLSKIMGQDITPENVITHRNLQDELIRRLLQQNYDLVDSDGFKQITPGMKVFIYQPYDAFHKRRNNVEDSPYTVERCNAGNYVVRRDSDGLTRIVQRKDIVLQH